MGGKNQQSSADASVLAGTAMEAPPSTRNAAFAQQQPSSGFDWAQAWKNVAQEAQQIKFQPSDTNVQMSQLGSFNPQTPGGEFNLNPVQFSFTPQQDKALASMGAGNLEKKKQFLVGRILAGDMTYGPYTAQQIMTARSLAARMQPSPFAAVLASSVGGR